MKKKKPINPNNIIDLCESILLKMGLSYRLNLPPSDKEFDEIKNAIYLIREYKK